MSISAFYRHGTLADSQSMDWLSEELKNQEPKRIKKSYNRGYKWRDPVVCSGLELAQQVFDEANGDDILLVGHSQGGLVCRVAAVALVGTLRPGKISQRPGQDKQFIEKIHKWQQDHGLSRVRTAKLAVVTIATPNAGALTLGQMSTSTAMLVRAGQMVVVECAGLHDLEDLTTPRLFLELENWTVEANYLSISGVAVNRYHGGMVQFLQELPPIVRLSIRFDRPNDGIVEDSSTDLRQSLIRPEVDLSSRYRHIRTYPNSITLNHCTVLKSAEVRDIVLENLDWLLPPTTDTAEPKQVDQGAPPSTHGGKEVTI